MSIERGRRLLYALAAATLVMVSVTAGALITKSLERADSSPSPAASTTKTAAPTTPATSTSPTATHAPRVDADLLAAISKDGDVVLVDPDTAAVVRTMPSVKNTLPADRVAWHAASGVVYFSRTRNNCPAIWRFEVNGGEARHIANGQRLAISPDGRRLAFWTCDGAPAGRLAIVDAETGKSDLSLPLSTVPADQGGGMWFVNDIDWRPDNAAVIVTAGWEADFGQFLVDLRKLPKSVTSAPVVPTESAFEESYHTVEYVGTRLVLSGSCCYPENESNRVVVRDGKSGVLTSLSTEPARELAADSKGRLRYLAGHGSDGGAALWALDRLDGVPRKIGGEFRAIDW